MNFDGKTVVLTGAAGNLGQAVAKAFGALGADLALIDMTQDRLARAFDGDSERRLLLPTNLLDQAAVDQTVSRTLARFGRIDVLCNIAGGFRMGTPVHETGDNTWNAMFDVNVRTLVHMVRAVVPQMLSRGSGKIVNIGAFAANKGAAQMGAYVAAKSAVIRLTETMAAELRERNINVNCVLPTILDTPDNRAAMPNADPFRWVALADLANVILFLASDQATAVHGAALPVTGLS